MALPERTCSRRPASIALLLTTLSLLVSGSLRAQTTDQRSVEAPTLVSERRLVLLPEATAGTEVPEAGELGILLDGRAVDILETGRVVSGDGGEAPRSLPTAGWRTLIYLDPALATPSGVERAVELLSRSAAELAALGPVEVVVADPFAEAWLEATRDVEALLATLEEMGELVDVAGELLAIRRDLAEARAAGSVDGEELGLAWREEIEVVEESRLELMRWLSRDRLTGPGCLILIQDGFDLGAGFAASLGATAGDAGRTLLDQNLRNHEQIVHTLVGIGWTLAPLMLGDSLPGALPDREAVLQEMATASGGVLVRRAADLERLLVQLANAVVVTMRASGVPQGVPVPLSVRIEGTEGSWISPSSMTLGSPLPLSEIRAIQTLEDPDRTVGPWPTSAILRADPEAGAVEGGFAAILEALAEHEGSIPAEPVMRVSVALVEMDGGPRIAHFLIAPGSLEGSDAWLYRQQLEISENLVAGIVVIEELGSGRWGSAPLELAEAPISVQGLEVAVWQAPAVTRDRIRTATSPPASREQAVIRVLPPRKRPVVGKTRFQTLVSSPIIDRVVFTVDGEEVASDDRAPFSAQLDLGEEVTMHRVAVIAFAAGGARLGSHEIVVNPRDDSFQVRISEITSPLGGLQNVTAEVRVPAESRLDRVEFYWNETLVETRTEPPFEIELPTPDGGSQAFVRVAAYLDDGTWIDDAQLLGAGAISERVEVNLVELHVVVTDRNGKPVEGLTEDDFSIRLGRETMAIQALGFAEEVPLTLGVVIDTSESMWPLMVDTQQAGSQFIANTLAEGDSAFLVDFDTQPRLAQDTTEDVMSLLRTFSRLRADGFTALYDAVIFSMLQFEEADGRKALVLLTDGDDYKSRYGPRRCIEYGKRLGVPVYIISLAGIHNTRRNLRRIDLEGITEGTGGQVFYIRQMSELAEAYATINRELRSQYILTFVTERALSELELEEIDVSVADKGLELRGVVGGQRVE